MDTRKANWAPSGSQQLISQKDRPSPGSSAFCYPFVSLATMTTPTNPSRSYGSSSAGNANEKAKKAGLPSKLKYKFYNTLQRGPMVLIGWLFLGSAVLSIPFTIYLNFDPDGIEGSGKKALADTAFVSLWGVLGKGNFPSAMWEGRVFGLGLTIASLLTGGAMFAFITATTSKKIADLRKGKGPVVEKDHIMILGWGPQVYSILQQLDVANENNPSVAVVVAPVSIETMNEELEARVGKLKYTKIVTRSLDPSNPKILSEMNIAAARSVIVLASAKGGVPSAVTGVLAVLANLSVESKTVVVADINDLSASDALMRSTAGRVVTVQTQQLIAQVTAHACRQPGLAAIYLDLLDFEGNEIYYAPAGLSAGHMFGEALLGFSGASLIGLRRADGTVMLAPPMNTVISNDDFVIAIAEDDDRIIWTAPHPEFDLVNAQIAVGAAPKVPAIQTLVLGWNPMGREVLKEINDFASPGSATLILAQASKVTADDLKDLGSANMQVVTKPSDGGYNDIAAVLPGTQFDQVIIFGYRGKTSTSEADSASLLSLLSVHSLKQSGAFGAGRARIIAEILDSNNVELARVVAVEDLVVSDRLASLMMTQLSQSPHLSQIFGQLFGPGGVYLNAKPISYYLPEGQATFAQLVAAGRARGEVVIGYRDNEVDAGLTSGIYLNPAKDSSFVVKATDQAIVIGPVE